MLQQASGGHELPCRAQSANWLMGTYLMNQHASASSRPQSRSLGWPSLHDALARSAAHSGDWSINHFLAEPVAANRATRL